ncbi:uncharacterized protein LOC128884247 isoform X1 [Hylaeus volcanicus]|uniref:uncharacterized protein LOC128884247 isoform X1 n=1 Tax=Hylaeus volcanicus TaxID=313075 RepID=UPI0023B7E979|nr:uncharacterized protein LOC128884247 isoform X1 [Hylaeus volcanicus]
MFQGGVQQEALRGANMKRKRFFRFQSVPFAPYSNEKECLQQYTMYDFYNSFSKEYFHRIMQLPICMRYAPPWKLGMHTNWLINDNVDPESVCYKESHTPSVFQKQWTGLPLQELTNHRLKIRQKNVTDGLKESCSGVLTTTATIGVSSDKLDLSSKEEACCLPRWSASSEIHTSGISVEKVITHSVQLYPTTGSKKTSLSLEVLQELDKHYSTNSAPWIVDDSTTLPVATSEKSLVRHSPTGLNASAIGTTCSSHGEYPSNCMNTAFLLHVKDTVARKQMQSKEALRLKKNSNPQFKCEQTSSEDYVLSHDHCVSFNTLYPTCKNGHKDECMSERSDRSTVAGKVNFKRPQPSSRVKLSNEKIFVKSHDTSTVCPSVAWNTFNSGEKKKSRRITMMQRNSLRAQAKLTCDSRLLLRKTTVSPLGQGRQRLDAKLAVRNHNFVKNHRSPQRSKKSVTIPSHQHNQKKLTKDYQRWLMEVLNELQKQRDMGLIVPSRFERKKQRVLNFLQSLGGDVLSIVPIPSPTPCTNFFSSKNPSFQAAVPGFSNHTMPAKKKMLPSINSLQFLPNQPFPLVTKRNFCKTIDITP